MEQGIEKVLAALREAAPHVLEAARRAVLADILNVLSTCCAVVAVLAAFATLNMWLAIDWYTIQYALKVGR